MAETTEWYLRNRKGREMPVAFVVDGGRSGVVQELSTDGVRAMAAGDRRDHLRRREPGVRQARDEATTETVRGIRGKL